jgi:hypothetical protein
MKKLNLFLFLLLLQGSLLYAAPVSFSQAQQVAENIYAERLLSAAGQLLPQISVSSSFTKTQDNTTLLYIFNFGEKQGFVIVCGDDHAMPVPAYSFSGAYDPAIYQPAFSDWLENYAQQVSFIISQGLPSSPAIDRQWELYSSSHFSPQETMSVGPLISTTWNQGCYYNEQCPAGTSACSHQWTGCGATAMAQMMRYHNYPANGIGTHSYTWNSITHMADFGATTYNYANMPASLSSSNADVAQLMYHCGIALDMQYGNSGSYCSLNYNSVMPQYFGYANIIENWLALFVPNDTVYQERIVGELDSLRPTFYKGSGSSGQHFFLCDGYQNSSYPFHFHFNWGWGGVYDGYYYCSALNPGSYSFTSGQGAVIRIMPPSVTTGMAEAGSSSLQVFPNPADEKITIRRESMAAAQITLFDLSGRELMSRELNAEETTIETGMYPPGVYLLQVRENNAVRNFRLVLE